ncbi:AAA family ATPase [Seohaeicola saemankumensis]|uniref:AAA family ATPase n=1 Tax=Seohaeicola saemankumensis TaxID=481181 RepID=A0ABW3T9I2_9RHOB
MNKSATLIRLLVERYISEYWAQDEISVARPFIRGLPLELAHELFKQLTCDGTRDWRVTADRQPVPVVLITAGELSAFGNPGVLSGISNWDYAITIRNSASSYVCIVTPDAALTVQHSMLNTTDPLDFEPDPERGPRFGSEPWADILADLEDDLGLIDGQRGLLRSLLERTWTLATEEGVGDRLAAIWQLIEEWSKSDRGDLMQLIKLAGFPCPGTKVFGIHELERSFYILNNIGDVATRRKNYAAFEDELITGLGNFPDEESAPIERAIREFVSSLKSNISSVTVGAFVANLCRSYAEGAGNKGWWHVLSTDIWERLLKRTSSGPLSVAINVRNCLKDPIDGISPAIVSDEVEVSLVVRADQPHNIVLTRSEGRRNTTPLELFDNKYTDENVPAHSAPLTYTAKLQHPDASKQSKVAVISLASFSPGMFCLIQGGQGHEVRNAGKETTTVLDVQLRSPGLKDVEVFVRDGIVAVGFDTIAAEEFEQQGKHCSPDLEALNWLPVTGGKALVRGLDVGSDVVLRLVGRPSEGSPEVFLNAALSVSPEDIPTKSSPCVTSSLISMHRGAASREDEFEIVAPSRALEEIEDGYLKGLVPLRPMLACWGSKKEVGDRQSMDLEAGRLGRIAPGLFKPDVQQAPEAFIDARSALLKALQEQRRPLREIHFDEIAVVEASKKYLFEYVNWLATDLASAAWAELVACYGVVPGHGMDRPTSSSEPHIVLMGPLHPLKVAFHTNTHLLLRDIQGTARCPLAGFLDPHSAPSIMELRLCTDQGDQTTSTQFLNAGSSDPFWTVFWASRAFEKREQETVLLPALGELRLLRPGLNGGFDASLIRQALQEVESLSPTRTSFQIGLKGDPQGSSTSAEELLNWCAKRATPERRYRVFDERELPAVPSDESLAYISMEKPDAVQWFQVASSENGGRDKEPSLDVLVIDDLGTREWSKIDHQSFASIAAPKGLFRSQTRADVTDGQIVQVAFAIDPSKSAYKASDELRATALLEGPCFTAGNSHYRFRPNTSSILQRLDKADFVAVTSQDVDPACFIHGAGATGAVLWDYELPSLSGRSSSSSGYYLVAKPRKSMRTAIKSAVQLLEPEEAEAERITNNLEKEVAIRGMPILRRLGRGGSTARGELGVLLALRALQGKIGNHDIPSVLPLHDNGRVNLLVAVDPYWDVFEEVRKKIELGSTYERPDILVFSIDVRGDQRPASLLVTPLEVKFRSSPMTPDELGKALGQATNLGRLLAKLWGLEAPTELWKLAGLNLLANCVEHGFRVGAAQMAHGLPPDRWAALQERVILDILSGSAKVRVNQEGRLLAFDNRENTRSWRLGLGAEQDTVTVGRQDALYLLHDSVDGRDDLVTCIRELRLSLTPDAGIGYGSDELWKEEKDRGDTGKSSAELSASLALRDEVAVDSNNGQSEPAGEDYSLSPELEQYDQPYYEDSGEGRENEQTHTASIVSPKARRKVDAAFEGFVGNEEAVKTLKRGLLAASLQTPPHLAKAYLLSGPPSTGKTELSRRVANALGLPFVALDGKAVDSRDKLFSYIRSKLEEENAEIREVRVDAGRSVREYPPFVVLIDEVHLVKRAVQEAMLTLLEASDRQVSLKDEVAVVRSATFIFATTRTSDLDAAFKTRCAEVKLQPYSVAEVAEMLTRVATKKPIFESAQADMDTFVRIASVGRSVPRVALQVLEELEQEILVSSDPGKPVQYHLQEVMRSRGVDEQGIGRIDLDVLEVLEAQTVPIGQDSLISLLPTVDKEEIRTEVEPFLRKLGYIELTKSGRIITAKGRNYIIARRMAEQQ